MDCTWVLDKKETYEPGRQYHDASADAGNLSRYSSQAPDRPARTRGARFAWRPPGRSLRLASPQRQPRSHRLSEGRKRVYRCHSEAHGTIPGEALSGDAGAHPADGSFRSLQAPWLSLFHADRGGKAVRVPLPAARRGRRGGRIAPRPESSCGRPFVSWIGFLPGQRGQSPTRLFDRHHGFPAVRASSERYAHGDDPSRALRTRHQCRLGLRQSHAVLHRRRRNDEALSPPRVIRPAKSASCAPISPPENFGSSLRAKTTTNITLTIILVR